MKKIKITAALKRDLEHIAAKDGITRAIFFDTSGNMRIERLSATAVYDPIWRTKNGRPFTWEKPWLSDVLKDAVKAKQEWPDWAKKSN